MSCFTPGQPLCNVQAPSLVKSNSRSNNRSFVSVEQESVVPRISSQTLLDHDVA
jgi:hypothetical protein